MTDELGDLWLEEVGDRRPPPDSGDYRRRARMTCSPARRRDRLIPSGPPCATCGKAPTSSYRDGSPSYSCGPHEPITDLERCDPGYVAWVRAYGLAGPLQSRDGQAPR